MATVKRDPFRYANRLVLVAIIGINLYIIGAPVWPQINFWWQKNHSGKTEQLQQALRKPTSDTSTPTAQGNRLIIPAIQLEQPILEGPEQNWDAILRQGVWRWPDSSTPDKGGNTVFLAHRFSYTGPHGAFYFLDKLKTGDEIGVTWGNKRYIYSVVSEREVPPTEVSILNNTEKPRITLYTCTPIWHPVNRLVIVAELKEQL